MALPVAFGVRPWLEFRDGRQLEPEHKGIIERAHDYFERSFLPGREFTVPGDINYQFSEWLLIVNARRRGQDRLRA